MGRWSQVGLGAVVTIASVLASCSKDRQFGDGATAGGAPATGTSGNTTAAGEAAEASGGQSGSPTELGCSVTQDCDDGLFCNGQEACEAGECVRGSSPCENPDVAHCEARCSEGRSRAVCGVQPRDDDEDGHGSAACLASPGDDCDDAVPAVHEGAAESCDGIDNDCNGRSDMSDGLDLGGATVALTFALARTSDIAWLEEAKLFGLTWFDYDPEHDFTDSVVFASYDAKGKLASEPKALAETPTGYQAQIAAGDGGFGIVWRTNKELSFVETTPLGVLSPVILTSTGGKLVTNHPEVSRSSEGTWALVSDGLGVTVAGSGAVSGALTLVAGAQEGLARIAPLGNGFVFVAPGAEPQIVPESLAEAQPVSAPVNLGRSLLASAGDRFAVVAAPNTAGQAKLSAFDVSGLRTCGPINVGLEGHTVADAVATERGYTLAMVADAAPFGVWLQEVSTDCVPSTAFATKLVANGGAFSVVGQAVRLAYGSEGYAVMWNEGAMNGVKVSFFGKAFCD